MSRWGLCSKVAALVLFAGVNAQAETDWSNVLFQARQLRSEGRTQEAETFLLKAWKEAERSPAGPQWIAALCHQLGLVYATVARYDESEKFFTRALRNWELTSPPDPTELVITANSLVLVYLTQLRITRTEALYHSSAGTAAEALSRDDPDRARWRYNWATVLLYRGNLEEAGQIYRESLRVWEKVFGPDSPDVVTVLNNLGSTYRKMNRLDDALRCHERIRSISEGKGMKPVVPLLNLADICLTLHRDEEAEALYRQVLYNIAAMRGPDHPLMAEALEQYASALRKWKRKSEAAKLHRQAKDILARHTRNTPARQSVDVCELALR